MSYAIRLRLLGISLINIIKESGPDQELRPCLSSKDHSSSSNPASKDVGLD